MMRTKAMQPHTALSYTALSCTSLLYTVRSEIWKLLTSRSMMTVALGTIVLPVLLACATGFSGVNHAIAQVAVQDQGFEVTGFGQPLVILLAALTVSSEYASGQIRTSLAATPQRMRLMSAKAIVTAFSAVLIGLIATPMAVFLEQWARAGVAGRHFTPAFTVVFTQGMRINVLTVALNYMLIALIAQSLTVITRSIIATIVILVPMVLGFTIGLVTTFPILRFLPDLAGIQLLTRYPGLPLLSPLPGALVMATWAMALLALSFLVFNRQDING